MKDSRHTSKVTNLLSVIFGAFVALLLPANQENISSGQGIIHAIISFELNYINVISTVGVIWLVYWLLKRRVQGREGMVIYGALGFVCLRLAVASMVFLHQ